MATHPSIPEHRLTVAQSEMLTRLASQMSIQVKPVLQGQGLALELSGEGFSGVEPLTLPITVAYARLLAEVCSNLAPWAPFSPAEPCEVTLFGLGEERLNAALRKYQYRLTLRLTEKLREEKRARRRLFSSNDAPPAADGLEAMAV